MDMSGQEPSSLVQVQSRKFLNCDRPNPQFFGTLTELAWTASDQSSTVSRFRVFFHCIGLLMKEIYLNGT